MPRAIFIFFLFFFHLFQLAAQKVWTEKNDSTLIISIGQQPVLSYFFEVKYPPKGVDTVYKRSGFIHPLSTLNGHILTRIQPQSHYHHYGFWDAWTRVEFEGDTLDFWNLKKREGTVRFVDFKKIKKTGFTALQEYIVLKSGAEKTALKERFNVKVSAVSEEVYTVDINLEFSCATDSPFKILEYRYAGFCWRTTEEWHKGNSEVLTSEGKTRLDADASTARWFLVQGDLDKDYGGGLILSHPDNYNHPEPLRIWPIKPHDRSDIMAMFSPTKTTDWLMLPRKKYCLKYRLIVFGGKMTIEKANKYWKEYAKK